VIAGPSRAAAPLVRALDAPRAADVLGIFGGHSLARDADGRLGWWQPEIAQKESASTATR
jgi:hypothetical protein